MVGEVVGEVAEGLRVGKKATEIGKVAQAADDLLPGSLGREFPPRKGKTFRGGSKHARDNWYGYDRDNGFVRWWHRQGKHEFGGNDIDNAAEAKAVYEHWLQLGKPVPK